MINVCSLTFLEICFPCFCLISLYFFFPVILFQPNQFATVSIATVSIAKRSPKVPRMFFSFFFFYFTLISSSLFFFRNCLRAKQIKSFIGNFHTLTSLINSCSLVPSTVDTDHELVCADLLIGLQNTETESDKLKAQRPRVHVRNFSGMDMDAFCTDLEKKELQNFSNELDVDLMWDEWSQKFHDVLDKHAPVRSVPRKRSRTHRFCPWSTPQLP